MDIVRFSIEKPVVVIVGILLVTLFGLIGLARMPYQLTPSVTEPEISVATIWTGATPYEIEREIVEEQEKALKGLPGLVSMESTASDGRGEISLRFRIGTEVNEAFLRVSNKLGEVPSYPTNVERPVITATGARTSPIVWLVLKTLPDNPLSINAYRTYFEEEVRQQFERVPGVADLEVFGGTENEMHVVVDPAKLAAHRLTVDDLIAVLDAENRNVSAGTLDLGRRSYRIRTVGEVQSPGEIEDLVISSTGQRRITVADVATVEFGYAKKTVFLAHNKEEAIVCGVKPEAGANVPELTDRIEAAVKQLNDGKLKDRGLRFTWVYDQRPYIRGAIELVQQNIVIGGVLAILVLFLFLQSVAPTLIVSAAIPISIVGAFIFMSAAGRTLNVVSLAGISFAVGMLVDNAIVALENIDRHRRQGKSAFDAAYNGVSEVWGALVASTATTVAVFLPVIFMEEEAGQLFKDIAIAVTCAITLSLFVSICVIPMLANRFYRVSRRKGTREEHFAEVISGLGRRLADFYMTWVRWAVATPKTRLTTIAVMTSFSFVCAWLFFPKMEYLPQGNQNFILSIMVPPPGLSLPERTAIGEGLFAAAEPLMGNATATSPGIRDVFYVGAPDFMFVGASSLYEDRGAELIPFFTGQINSIPGMFGVSMQAGIFQQTLGGGRTINVDLSAGNMDQVMAAALTMFMAIQQAIPGAQVRPVPSLELLYPEVKLLPERDRLKAAGMSAEQLGVLLDVLMDGRKVGEFKQEGRKSIDLLVTAPQRDLSTPEELYRALIATPAGDVVPVSSLARLEHAVGVTQIRHLERQRTVTLEVTPPAEMPLEKAMEIIAGGIVPQLKGQGQLDGIDFNMSGQADKLTKTRQAMQWNFLLAVVITYLLLAALYGNFLYPLIILFTVPLAAAGGILGIRIENLLVAPQPMDILTMLGFVILVGVVVNNAILIVHQSLNNIRLHGMEHMEAVVDSVRGRLRPIYMSTLTSLFGMLPLVIAPGPGSELYRGLGCVIIGGMLVATLFTIFVIPALLMFAIGREKPRAGV